MERTAVNTASTGNFAESADPIGGTRPATPNGAEDRARCEDMKKLLDAVVMVVDDEPLNIEVTQIHLEEAGYTKFVSTSDPLQALPLLADRRPDVLLLDLMMPGMSGLEILARMQTENILKDVPTIVLTSSKDPATKLRALELGATDFLAKPVDPSELLLRLRNTLAAKAYRDRLANYDLLTGLPNRHTFMDRLDWALRHAERYGHNGAVLQVGLDEFKRVNEALGPALGDAMLQDVAQRLEQCLRVTDTIGRVEGDSPRASLSRLSGDEFTLLLPTIRKSDDAALVAQRILEAICVPFHLSEHELTVTCSIGIAVFPNDGVARDTVVKNAAAAMQHAKQRGKNTSEFYSSELNARALQKLSLTTQLRKALERDELVLYYQPKVDIGSGSVTGAEALVRWQHPERGLVFPNDFIPLAEENGLIVPLGECVMRAACRQSKIWQAAGDGAPRIAVNVSSHQFRQGNLVEIVAGILKETGADPQHLSVELTEGVIMENAEANVQTLLRLKEMGVKLSIDDFGTGYSSLSYLSKFPLDELKIDRSFVMQIKESGDRSAIITAIIAMAHSLELSVVAEGIETEPQLAFLTAQGCDEFQGYLKSKPVPADEFTARFVSKR
jgi:diguanylate cyclase (GGDEF)-like protein